MFLQGAEKLGLQVDGQVADFVQKQRALAGGFEQTLLGMLRSGERSLDVAEQFGFDQRGNQRGTVHRGKRLILPRPGKMNRARHQFLAGAALSQDQDRIVVLRDFLDQLVHALHAGRHAHESAKTGPALQLFAQQPVFLIGFDGMHQAIELGAQFLHVKWLRNVVGRAELGGFDGRLDRSVLRQHDDRDLRIIGANSLDAVPIRRFAEPAGP